MNNKSTNLVPKLRFPEFIDSDDWEEPKLGKIATNLDYKRIPITEGDRVKGKIPYYGASGIIDYVKDFIFDEDLLCISEDGANLVTRSYPIAFSIYGKTWVNNHAHVLKFKENFTKIIVENYLNSINLEKYLTGIAQPKLNRAKLDVIPIYLPKKEEQKKIADCISSIDEVITSQNKKLESLKEHKKGLMQNLFPAEGETVPKLRFPEFKDSCDWKKTTLEKVFSIFQGFAFSSKDSKSSGVRWVKIADVGIQKMNNSNPSFLPIEYKEKYNKFSLYLGDYVIALTRPILDKKLKIAPIDYTYNGSLLNQRVGKILTSENQTFIYFLIQTFYIIENIDKNIAGCDPPNLSTKEIEKITVYIPKIEEQKKIADCLSSIDELITSQTNKIEALKEHKKGLMQQLFPVIDEVN